MSAHQVEGNTHNQWSVWELENAKSLAAKSVYQFSDLESWDGIKHDAKNPQNYVSGQATDHYHRYIDDFKLAKKMNANAWRTSIEWSRIQPDEGAWNANEVEHYKKYFSTLKAAGIEPIVTLFHFTLPVWFAEKGGFAKRANVRYFVEFCDRVLQEIGGSVKYVVTINEPEVYAKESYLHGHWPPQRTSKKEYYAVLNNLALAHNKVADVLHKNSRRFKVSIAKNSTYFYAGDDAALSEHTASVMQYVHDDYFIKKVIKRSDFLALNYYFSDRVYGYRIHNPEDRVSDLGWDLQPGHLEHALTRVWEKYKKPIMITENGIADAQDEQRKWWLTQTVLAMQRSMNNGVELWGYLHWSLTDNFEWDKGRWPRFGLFAIDYETLERKPRPSAALYAGIIKKTRS
jgi:beta-glucosidase